LIVRDGDLRSLEVRLERGECRHRSEYSVGRPGEGRSHLPQRVGQFCVQGDGIGALALGGLGSRDDYWLVAVEVQIAPLQGAKLANPEPAEHLHAVEHGSLGRYLQEPSRFVRGEGATHLANIAATLPNGPTFPLGDALPAIPPVG
jgi:hypothetical protein